MGGGGGNLKEQEDERRSGCEDEGSRKEKMRGP